MVRGMLRTSAREEPRLTWETELKGSISTVEQLRRYVDLGPREEKQLRHIIGLHPMRIPRYYAGLIDWDDPADPLRRIAVPDAAELDLAGSYDTSGEQQSTKLPGLQHKYAQTALVLATNRCALYCRHCFRKRLVGLPSEEVLKRFSDAARYIEKHKEIRNVLLSGGDPLVLPTRLINRFLERLSKVSHLNYVRIGTRVPVTFPGRILSDADLLSVLRRHSRKFERLYLVTQFEHPREITVNSTEAADRLIRAGVVLINQAILLKGVNDNPTVLAELHSKLVKVGIGPYYLFQCRPVKRVKRRFQVPLKQGYKIVESAKAMLDGPSKRFRYVMSHRSGKIEILGVAGDEIYLKYHQARDPNNLGRFFKRRLVPDAGWLDDLPRIAQQP
jgi:lysine 2,3-aminomutase